MRIAFISDVHYGPPTWFEGKLAKLTQFADELTLRFVDRMNREFRPDLVVNLGDVVEDESRELDMQRYGRFVEVLSGLDAERLHVAGNHDQYNLTQDDLRKLWNHAGELHYSRDVGGLHFAVLRTVEHKNTRIELPPEQLPWLEQDLAATSLPSIVLMHHPASEMRLEGNRWFEKQPHICRVTERRALRGVIERSGRVIAVFNGHVHWNHFDVISSIPYVTVQSLTENLSDDAPGRPANAWAVCDVDEHRLVITVFGEQPARYQVERRAP
jgi:3',5'-cyclic-AMP phosphodiesterase